MLFGIRPNTKSFAEAAFAISDAVASPPNSIQPILFFILKLLPSAISVLLI